MTDQQRIDRIQRLISLKQRDRDSAQGALADAQRKAAVAADKHREAETRWEDEADDVAELQAADSVREFAERRSHLNALRRKANHADQKRDQSSRTEESKRAEATDAHREVRKMELWSESEVERIRVKTARNDQRATDEIAAQRTRQETL